MTKPPWNNDCYNLLLRHHSVAALPDKKMPENQSLISAADEDGLFLGKTRIPEAAIDMQWVQIMFYCVHHDCTSIRRMTAFLCLTI
jgi:hypothetical protein